MHVLARVGIIVALVATILAIFLHQHTLYLVALVVGIVSIVLLIYALVQERKQSAS